jgi:peptidyl-prolyl cis-trans isomerase C
MAMRFHALTCITVGALAFGCGSSKKSGDDRGARADAVAQLDDSVITVGDLERSINSQSPYARSRYQSMDKKKELLDDMVRLELFNKEAQRRGLTNDPELSRTIKELIAQRLMKDEVAKVKMEDISDSDTRDYYEAHRTAFNQPEQVQVAWIVVKDASDARRVLADGRIKAAAGDEAFRRLVAESSQDPVTKDKGGLLPFFDDTPRAMPKEVIDAAFSLANPGDVSAPVKVPTGLAILKLVARKKAVSRQYTDVKQQLRNILYRDRQQERKTALEKELREKSNLKIDEAKLTSVRIEGAVDLPVPAPLPQGNNTPVGSNQSPPAR